MTPSRTRIKVCGVCRAGDARAAVAAGADAVGVVLAPSKRRLTLAQAEAVVADVPPGVARVGVFVDADPAFVAEAVDRLGLDYVQFHGSETPEMCAAAPAPVVKAFRVGSDFDPACMEPYRGRVAAVLVDTLVPGEDGGSGIAFDWSALGAVPNVAPVVLAGGLAPDNVREAVRTLRPAAVDVSSGVEARLGEKDPDKMRAFCDAVRAADQEESRR